MLKQYLDIKPPLSLNDVLSIVGYEKSWLFELIRLGKFPKPDRKVGKKNQWSNSIIEKYLDERATEKMIIH